MDDEEIQGRNSLSIIDSPSFIQRKNLTGIDNVSFQGETSLDLVVPNTSSPPLRHRSISVMDDLQDGQQTQTNGAQPDESKRKRKYHWKMSHYFYIHIFLFIINGLLGGLVVYLIENYSSSKNLTMTVEYIDAWFISATCVFSCGLSSLDFAKLSVASQSVLMFLTFISGITISTLPALAIKAYTHKHVAGIRVDDDHGKLYDDEAEDLPTINTQRRPNLPPDIREKLRSLPTATQLRYRAYIACIVLILGTCFAIYLIGFIAIGAWLDGQYSPEDLMQDNSTVNPWYISFVVVLTGFNQNGLTPFSTGFSRFVSDVYLNIFVMLVVMFGTSLFPFLLHNVIVLTRALAPWRYQVIFDYILTNNHRLSTLLFPAVQTRLYLIVTIILSICGVGISLILDLNGSAFAAYPPGTRVLIFFFHTINARFAGFQTVDMNSFATATLIVYLLLMATKPQMLCSLDESPLEINWLALQAKEEVVANVNVGTDLRRTSGTSLLSRAGSLSSISTGLIHPMRDMERFLRRQSLVTKDLVRKEFTSPTIINGITEKPRNLSNLRKRLFLIYFTRSLIKNTVSFVILTRTWLFFFIFLICAIEYRRMDPVDREITVTKIVFEIISAFGAVGLSLGYPGVASSFSTVLSPACKVIIILTMLMARHRGLLASMTDQEVIEFSASELLARKRDELINQYERETLEKIRQDDNAFQYRIDRF